MDISFRKAVIQDAETLADILLDGELQSGATAN